MANELKPCPFCGSHNVLLRHYDPYDGYQGDCGVWEAWCAICDANIERRQKEESIEAWNRRVESEELKFTRQFIHEHGLEFALASAWKRRCNDGT